MAVPLPCALELIISSATSRLSACAHAHALLACSSRHSLDRLGGNVQHVSTGTMTEAHQGLLQGVLNRFLSASAVPYHNTNPHRHFGCFGVGSLSPYEQAVSTQLLSLSSTP